MKKRKPVRKTIARPEAVQANSVVQSALPIAEPMEGTFQGELKKRLGHRAFVSVSLVASACDVSVMTVFSWIQAGVIDARNVSVADRPYYRIYAPSVIKFLERGQS